MTDDRLRTAREALRHQREWFAELRAEAEAGRPVALVNADVPHELFRAFDVPYVVNQWWSSVAASRGAAQSGLDAVARAGLPRDSEPYNTIGLGNVLNGDADDVPGWGVLPRPALVATDRTGDVTGKLFEAWRDVVGVELFAFESAVQTAPVEEWWQTVADQWEHVVGSRRIDLMVAELRELIPVLERISGRAYDETALREIMRLGNEQAEWNRRTRDLIAAARPLPVRVTDTIPAVMLPQWHRGTEWGRDAARALHDEIAERVEAGRGVVADERARLMWIGRGLWFDMDFYRHFEEQYGAVFVWSMYLSIAADGYARYGGDPLRALASRFIGFPERLYVAPEATEWYVDQAQQHGVDGVVHLVSDDPRGGWAITRALEEAGIPVFVLRADNADESAYDAASVRAQVADWLESRVEAAPARR
ncbi:(R)-phenyllactyl-CoA dehydratase alpha subunit [Microbacterium lemovicicum]|uniref:(R)-phenyllactyl-CoA dehydratase alpha subunit n=1 Tax=Microbacterium lemovicicum TaxID=1072463 RepID=A0A3S9WF05_9MICO|nr:2-hydroxyacyl-CoA dehydratase family protein [Microbacterium lemovicicum]AZS38634.1 (R)-phenyllactyl-CoA dehydratase alpha subunit [Microbacterium lemovicicum]